MHEYSIVEELFRVLETVVRREGLTTVDRVTVRVGALRQIVPELFCFAFDAAKAGTAAAAAELQLETAEALMKCEACGREFHAPADGNACPGCGGFDFVVLQGKEIEIVSIEGEQ